jgi:hypothetical protein
VLKPFLSLGLLLLTTSSLFLNIIHAEAPLASDTQPDGGERELSLLRSVAAAPIATLHDLCAVIVIQRGELSRYTDSREFCGAVESLKIYSFSVNDLPLLTPVTAGAASKAAINTHRLEKTIMFLVTGLEWYAVQNAEALGLLPAKTPFAKQLSGAELLAIMEIAYRQAEARDTWGVKKNPYEAFGATSYEELDNKYGK